MDRPSDDEIRALVERILDPDVHLDDRLAVEDRFSPPPTADGRPVDGFHQWALEVPGRPRVWAIVDRGLMEVGAYAALIARAFAVRERAVSDVGYRVMDAVTEGDLDGGARILAAWWSRLLDAYQAGEWEATGDDREEVLAIIGEDIAPDLAVLREEYGGDLRLEEQSGIPELGQRRKGLLGRLRRR